MKPRDECLFYLVREMCGLGVKAKDVYLNDAIRHVRDGGLDDMSHIEFHALVMAAGKRHRLFDLDAAVDALSGCVRHDPAGKL